MRTVCFTVLAVFALSAVAVRGAENGTESGEDTKRVSSIEFKGDKSEIEFGRSVATEEFNSRSDTAEDVYYDEYEDENNEVSEGAESRKVSGDDSSTTVSPAEDSDTKGVPTEVFLTMRNLSEDGDNFRTFKKRNDPADLQASASDNVGVAAAGTVQENGENTTAEQGWNSRAYRDAKYPLELSIVAEEPLHHVLLPYQHSSVDAPDLSDCARQGEWRPIGEIHVDSNQNDLQQEHDYLIPAGSHGDQSQGGFGVYGNNFGSGEHSFHGFYGGGASQGSFAEFQKLTADAASAQSTHGGFDLGQHLGNYVAGSVSSYAPSFGGIGEGGGFGDGHKGAGGGVISYSSDFGKTPLNHNFNGHGDHHGGGGQKFYHGQGNLLSGSGSGGYGKPKQPGLGSFGGGAPGGGAFLKGKPGGHIRYAPGGFNFNRKPGPSAFGDGPGLSLPPKGPFLRGKKPGGIPWKSQKGKGGGGFRRPNFDSLKSGPYLDSSILGGSDGSFSTFGGHGGSGPSGAFHGGHGGSGSIGALSGGHGGSGSSAVFIGDHGGSGSSGGLLGGHGGLGSSGAILGGHGGSGSSGALLGGYGGSGSFDGHSGGHGGSGSSGALLGGHGGSGSSGALLGGYGSSGSFDGHSGGHGGLGSSGAILGGHGGSGSSGALLAGYGGSGSFDGHSSGHGGLGSSGAVLGGHGSFGDATLSAAIVGGHGDGGSSAALLGNHGGLGSSGAILGGHGASGYSGAIPVYGSLGSGGFGFGGSGSLTGHKGTVEGGSLVDNSLLSGHAENVALASALTDQSYNGQNVGHITHEAILQDASQLTSFTCGKNHDHGTNYHTASFQVAEDDHGSQDLLQYQDGAHVIIHAANNGFDDVIHAERKTSDDGGDSSAAATKESSLEIITGSIKGASNHRYTETGNNDENSGTSDQIEEPTSHSFYRDKFPSTEKNPIQFEYGSDSEKPQIIKELEELSSRFHLDLDNAKYTNGKGISYETFFTDHEGGEKSNPVIHNGFSVVNVNDFESNPKEDRFRFEEYQNDGDVITEYPYYTVHQGRESPESQPVVISEHHPHSGDKPKTHIPPKRKHPGKQYEVHENSGEKQIPTTEIFPPQKFPRQFHNPMPNLAGRPPKDSPSKYHLSSPYANYPILPPVQFKKFKKYKPIPGKGKYRRPVFVRRPIPITSAPILRVSVSS